MRGTSRWTMAAILKAPPSPERDDQLIDFANRSGVVCRGEPIHESGKIIFQCEKPPDADSPMNSEGMPTAPWSQWTYTWIYDIDTGEIKSANLEPRSE
jgi:hypothetical protein